MNKHYQPLPTNCNVASTSLVEAALRVGPSFIYTLTVHQHEILSVSRMLKAFQAVYLENPFAPYLNLVAADPAQNFKPYEWMLSANGKACGAEGI